MKSLFLVALFVLTRSALRVDAGNSVFQATDYRARRSLVATELRRKREQRFRMSLSRGRRLSSEVSVDDACERLRRAIILRRQRQIDEAEMASPATASSGTGAGAEKQNIIVAEITIPECSNGNIQSLIANVAGNKTDMLAGNSSSPPTAITGPTTAGPAGPAVPTGPAVHAGPEGTTKAMEEEEQTTTADNPIQQILRLGEFYDEDTPDQPFDYPDATSTTTYNPNGHKESKIYTFYNKYGQKQTFNTSVWVSDGPPLQPSSPTP